MPTLDQMHDIYSESTRLFGDPPDVNADANERNNGNVGSDSFGHKHANVGSGDRTSSSQAGEDTAQTSPSRNNTTTGPFGIVPKNPFDSFNNDDDDSDDDGDKKKGGGGFLYNGPPDLDIFEDSSKDESSHQNPNSQRGRSKERKGGVSPSGAAHDDDDDDDAYLFDSVNSNEYDLSNHSERNQFVDLLSGNNRDSNGSKNEGKTTDDDGSEVRSSIGIGNTNRARNGSDNEDGRDSGRNSIGNTNHAIDGNKDDRKAKTRSDAVENYGDNSSDDDSSANSANLEKYATMQEILNDNSDRTRDMGRSFRKGFGGICCRANGCCDRMLGEKKTKRRKVSVAMLAFTLVLFVVVLIVFILVIAKGKESVKESDMYRTEFEDVSASSTSSPSWAPASVINVTSVTNGTNGTDASEMNVTNVTNRTDDSENVTPEIAFPTRSPLGSDADGDPGPPMPENDAGSSDPVDITLLTDTISVRLYFTQMSECTQANLDMESCLVSTAISDFIADGIDDDNGMARRRTRRRQRNLQEDDDCDTPSFNEEDEINFLGILNDANSKCNNNNNNAILPTTPVGSDQQELAAASTAFLQIFNSAICWKELCENGPNPRLEFDVSFDEAAKCAENASLSSNSRVDTCIMDVVFEVLIDDDGSTPDSDDTSSGQVMDSSAPRRMMQEACEHHPSYDDYYTSLTSAVVPGARAQCAEDGVALTTEELDDAMSIIATVFAAEQCWLNSVGGCDDDDDDGNDIKENDVGGSSTDINNLPGSSFSEPPSYYPTWSAATYAPSSPVPSNGETSATSYYSTQDEFLTTSATSYYPTNGEFPTLSPTGAPAEISTPVVSPTMMPSSPSVMDNFNTTNNNVTTDGNNTNTNNNDTSIFTSTISTIMPNLSSDSNSTTSIMPVSDSMTDITSTSSNITMSSSTSVPTTFEPMNSSSATTPPNASVATPAYEASTTLGGEPSPVSEEIMEEMTAGLKVILSGVSTVADENSWEEMTEKFYEDYYNDVSGLLVDADVEISIESVRTLNVRRSLLRRRRRILKIGSSNPDYRELQMADVPSVEVAYTQITRYRSKEPDLVIEEIVQMPLGTEMLRDEFVGELKALYGYEQLTQVSEIAAVFTPALSSTPAELYHDESWDELPANIRGAYVVLGYNETIWNNETMTPESEDMDWDGLSLEIRTAALEIGYTKELWDNTNDDTIVSVPIVGGNITNASKNSSRLDSSSVPVSSPISNSMPSSSSLAPFQLSFNSTTSASSVPTPSVATNSSIVASGPSDVVAVNSSGVGVLGTTNETVSVSTNITSNDSGMNFSRTTSSFMPSSSPETLGTSINGSVVNNVSNDTVYGTASSSVSEGSNDNQPRMNAPSFVSFTPVSLDILSDPYIMHVDRKSPLMSSLSRYGSSVAISSDGNFVAVGATEATNEARDTTGAVYLYSLGKTSESASANSLSLVQVLYGQSPMAEFGNAVSLSHDGNRLVVGSRSENDQTGAIRIYQRDTSSAAEEEFTVVGGATFTSSTIVDGATTSTSSEPNLMWSLMEGGVISGQNAKVRAGWSVSISADGNVIAMGSPAGGNNKGGSILTFKYNNLSSEWETYGSMIEGLAPGQAAGFSTFLSGTGSTMIVGSPKAKRLDGTINAGKSAVYFMNGLEWQLLGQDIYGEAESYIDGTSVAMSQDGRVVVVGGKGRNEVNATTGEVILRSAGHCHIYQFQYDQWEFQHSIEGKVYEERLGFSVAVSSDGNVVACGGISGAKGNSKSGVVRLWNRATLQESTIWPRGEVADVEGATFGTSVAISGDGEYVIIGAPTWTEANGGSNSEGAIQIFRVAT